MKKVVVLLLFAAIAASIMSVSCTDNPSVSEVQQPEENLADYTIIFYGHGGANLDKDIISNLSQFYLAEKGSYEHVKIVAQYKYSTKENLTNTLQLYVDYGMLSQQDFEKYVAMGGQTVRTIIDPQQGDEQLQTDIFGLPDCEIANPDSLTNFINWAAQVCPAHKYILILSNHGEGYLPHSDLAMTPSATRTIITDDGPSQNAFSVFSLAAGIKNAAIRPNVIYMDACLMNCIEYQFELKDLCDYIVASSYLVPGAGGEYTSLVNLLASEQDLEQALVKYCEAAVANWDNIYKNSNGKKDGEGTPVSYYDMTVTRTAQLESFGTKFRQFTDILLDAYQNGGEDVRAAIDNCTLKTLKAHYNQPHYDLPKYLKSIGKAVPTYFSNQFLEEMKSAYNDTGLRGFEVRETMKPCIVILCPREKLAIINRFNLKPET